ncbi:TPA: CPBP family intramembrane metalloprotease [Bacillus pseudomycoides]|nr:CPBP family intramembrane metalloprotease [Bacillus pseudomycoides]
MATQINRYLWNLKTPWFIILMTIATFVIIIPLDFILPEISKNPVTQETVLLQIILAVFWAPLSETLIFQVFLFWILRCIPWIREKDILIIVIASIIFGLSHQFGIIYIVGVVLIGLLYNYAYWLYEKKNEKADVTMSAFWVVFWIHLLHNLITLLISNFG